jgi:hypothetical protein
VSDCRCDRHANRRKPPRAAFCHSGKWISPARIQSAAVAIRIPLDGIRNPLACRRISVNGNRNLPACHRIPVGGHWISLARKQKAPVRKRNLDDGKTFLSVVDQNCINWRGYNGSQRALTCAGAADVVDRPPAARV